MSAYTLRQELQDNPYAVCQIFGKSKAGVTIATGPLKP